MEFFGTELAGQRDHRLHGVVEEEVGHDKEEGLFVAEHAADRVREFDEPLQQDALAGHTRLERRPVLQAEERDQRETAPPHTGGRETQAHGHATRDAEPIRKRVEREIECEQQPTTEIAEREPFR